MDRPVTSLDQAAFTHHVALLILRAASFGYACKVQEWNRDLETQRRYVAEGASKTMASKHLDKIAVDLYLLKDGAILSPDPKSPDAEHYRPLGEYWEALGGRWGGRFGLEDRSDAIQAKQLGWDCCHFEHRLT